MIPSARDRSRNVLTLIFSIAALALAGWGVNRSLHSSLFIVRTVEVMDLPDNAPLSSEAIDRLAAVPVGSASLIDLDLKAIEKRILADRWVKEVSLQKRLPQTLTISVRFKEPLALLQTSQGALEYLDQDGDAFGRVNLLVDADLPVLSGFAPESSARIRDALRVTQQWERCGLSSHAKLAALAWDPERGLRALVSYRLKATASWSRAMVDLGQEFDSELEVQLKRLSKVLGYLATNSIAAHQIYADAGKKIVVKTAHGS